MEVRIYLLTEQKLFYFIPNSLVPIAPTYILYERLSRFFIIYYSGNFDDCFNLMSLYLDIIFESMMKFNNTILKITHIYNVIGSKKTYNTCKLFESVYFILIISSCTVEYLPRLQIYFYVLEIHGIVFLYCKKKTFSLTDYIQAADKL